MASAFPLGQTSALLSIATEIRLRIYHYLFMKEPNVKDSIQKRSLTSRGRHPEILRVNHQIYLEAFPVFYSGLKTVDPSKGTWRYKPLRGDTQAYYVGDLNKYKSSDVIYDPPLMHDTTKHLKPAKFTKILIHAKFVVDDFLGDWRYDEENGKLRFALQQRLTDSLRATSTIDDLVEQVAGYAWVDHLDLDIALMASWERDQQSQDLPSFLTGVPGEAHWDRVKRIWRKGDILVADTFLASGVLDPLQRLSNIRSWCIELKVEDWDAFGFPSMHERMTLDLSNAIKRKRTDLRNGHDSYVVPCGLVWKPMRESSAL